MSAKRSKPINWQTQWERVRNSRDRHARMAALALLDNRMVDAQYEAGLVPLCQMHMDNIAAEYLPASTKNNKPRKVLS